MLVTKHCLGLLFIEIGYYSIGFGCCVIVLGRHNSWLWRHFSVMALFLSVITLFSEVMASVFFAMAFGFCFYIVFLGFMASFQCYGIIFFYGIFLDFFYALPTSILTVQ